MIPSELQKSIRQGNTGVLYKWLVGNADKYPDLDLNIIIKEGFRPSGKAGRTIPERALKLLRRYPNRIDPKVVKDVIIHTYDLGILSSFMVDYPTLVTTEDLRICIKYIGEVHGLDKYEEHIADYLNQIETKYPMLKHTPIWDAFITAELING